MLVLVHTDGNIDSDAEQARGMEAGIESALDRFDRDLTRIEIHLRDESAGRETPDDIRCLLEARPNGLDPVVVSHHATTVTEALDGATDKLEDLLTRTFDRRTDNRGRDTIRGRSEPRG